MTPAERLVYHINEFIHGFEQEATPEAHEMSMQFSDTCHALNDRLKKCADFLRKGMRSEAVQEALSQPSVFELAETLEFEEAKNWLNLCLDLGMVPAPELDLDTVEKLKTECTKEQLLEPLLREFRRLVHTGTRDERIHILRRIRSHDEDNQVWRENLEPLEQEQLVELQRRAGQAMAAEDLDEVLDIYTDMTAKHRVVEVPARALGEIESWLRRRRKEAAMEEGERLCENLHEALDKRDFDAVQPLIEGWRRLVKFPDFKPTPAMADIAGKAGGWYQNEEQARHRRHEFQEALQKLQVTLQKTDPKQEEIDSQWSALLAFEEDLPEGLEEAVTGTLARLRGEALRRRRNRALALAAAVILVISGSVAGGFFGFRAYKISQAKREMAALWGAERYLELRRYLDRIGGSPWLYEGAKADFYTTRVDQVLEAESERLANLGKAMDALEKVKTDGYSAGGSTISALLSEARSHAAADDEKALVEAWERGWKSWQRDRQTRIDADGVAKIEALGRQLTSAKQLDTDVDSSLKDLERLRIRAGKVADDIASASAPVKEQLAQVRRSLEKWGEELNDQKVREEANQRKYASLLAAIPQTAGDMEAWRNAVNEFLRAFPDAREAGGLRRALDQVREANDAVAMAGRQIADFPTGGEEAARFDALLKNLPGGVDSVWREALSVARAQYAGYGRMKAEVERLRMVAFYDLRQVKLRRKGEEEWRTLYYPEAFYSRELEGDQEGVTQYWGKVFGLKPEATEAVAEHLSVTSAEYEVQMTEDREKALIPAAQYIREFFAQLPEENLLPYLLAAFDELKDRTDIRLIPKATMLKIIGDAIETGIPIKGVGLEAYGDAFEGVNVSVDWYNHASPPVIETENIIRERLKSLPGIGQLKNNLRFNRDLLKASLNRKVQCVGLVWRNPDSGRPEPVVSRPGVKELFIVMPGEHGMPNQFYRICSAEADDTFKISSNAAKRTVLGQLLFAPTDGKTCEQVIGALPGPVDEKRVNWPSPWPVNARELK